MKTALLSALLTVVFLIGGLAVGIALGNAAFNALPGHSTFNPSGLHIGIAALPTLLGLLGGAALWGVWMQRLAQSSNRRRMAWAGALGFAPITLAIAVSLAVFEPFVIGKLGTQFPIHRIFTLVFVPAAFLIAGVSAWAIGIGLKNKRLALSLLWRVGLVAAAAFLVVNLGMEAAGWRVGGPNAAERFTMLTVLFMGNLAAALVGGGLLGWFVFTRRSALGQEG